jgi:hypothetical protein
MGTANLTAAGEPLKRFFDGVWRADIEKVGA